MEVTRTFDILDLYRDKHIKDDALAGKEDGIWVKYSSAQYVEIAHLVSYGLLAFGLKKGDRIATISNNRPEWNFVDMGMSQAGFIHVPIYPTISTEEYSFLIKCFLKRSVLSVKRLRQLKQFLHSIRLKDPGTGKNCWNWAKKMKRNTGMSWFQSKTASNREIW
jgi:long-subunit acyl-CoA synthetase (AMP-forming)